MSNYPNADYFKDLLLSIYPCKEPFELLVIDKKPKTKSGVYIISKRRIRIYAPWIEAFPLELIAIHEYTHHIHYTEQHKMENKERSHGAQFWEIYGALMCRAVQKGLFREERVSDIARKEHHNIKN